MLPNLISHPQTQSSIPNSRAGLVQSTKLRQHQKVKQTNQLLPEGHLSHQPLPRPRFLLRLFLSQASSRQAFDLPSTVLSSETVARQALDVATQALPHNEEPSNGKAKFKSRVRRALLRKFVLKMMLGKTVADWVYPWIHPKAPSRLPAM